MESRKPSKQDYNHLHNKVFLFIGCIIFVLVLLIAFVTMYGALFAMVSAPFVIVAYLIANFITLFIRDYIEKNILISFISIFLVMMLACYISFLGGGLLLSGKINLEKLFSSELSGLHILIFTFSAAYGSLYSIIFYILKASFLRKRFQITKELN